MKTLFIGACLLAACARQEIQPGCKTYALVSWKYSARLELLRIDTLANERVCGRWLDSIRVRIGKTYTWDWRNCPPPVPTWPEFRFEIHRYFILD
jgi:hypothetical protein